MNNSNSAIQKLSPFTSLSTEQTALKVQVEDFCKAHIAQHDSQSAIFTIRGDAGTGKSVVLSQLFNDIQTAARSLPNSPLFGTDNIFLVNHPEILKVYKELAGTLPNLKKKDFQRPTTFINQSHKTKRSADIVIIDEAHLLLSRPDRYNNFEQDNQLTEIMKLARVVIIVFDRYQVLKTKSYWDDERLTQLIAAHPHRDFHLHQQFRMQANAAVIDWIDALTSYSVLPLPKNVGDFEMTVFDDAQAMYDKIKQRDAQVGLSRIVATSGYPSKLDGGQHYVTEGQFKLPWDQYNYQATAWAELPATINEVGSIYTVQGFDLNYVGVILGPPIDYDQKTKRLVIHTDLVTDPEVFKRRDDLTNPTEIARIKEQLTLNVLNVLLKRGVHGLYIYASQPALRQRLNELS
ncbi:DUF2075 domain-containing protein [Furfurilactobacillus siliginis]|uniref:Schlafen group 3-like DNA/RNA helicase domain-containing protein n=1 Tax=Furfurilactobacillus siliginis TaxID=348151 RepID=A0A0R2KVG5_9LACO|nr:DUF2075 domain-containing protein [Furfurilactobacillus siliginis]KRN93515.1 hypothetical protein IV55_GL001019 [Furfurilactobacillus siliginis]GEK29420.1 hypothetical protein LSI01_17310 [Furfurilactobacillus siliginis]